MKCNNCGTLNEPDAIRCKSCNILLEGSVIAKRDKKPMLEEGEVLCKNCYTINSIQSLRCTNCNALLDGSMVVYNKDYIKHERPVLSSEPIKENISTHTKEASINTEFKPNNSETNACPKCGYINRVESSICVNCGATLIMNKIRNTSNQTEEKINKTASDQNSLKQETTKEDRPASTPKAPEVVIEPHREQEFIDTATVNPWATQKKVGFKLIPLQINDSSHVSELFYAGDEVVLNRANLENDNTTISNQAHATIKQIDGQWYISDNSSQQTTFVRVGNKHALANGDVILIGNRLFSFKAE